MRRTSWGKPENINPCLEDDRVVISRVLPSDGLSIDRKTFVAPIMISYFPGHEPMFGHLVAASTMSVRISTYPYLSSCLIVVGDSKTHDL